MTVGRINGGPQKRVFFLKKKMYGRFSGQKKSGRNNMVTLLPRWP